MIACYFIRYSLRITLSRRNKYFLGQFFLAGQVPLEIPSIGIWLTPWIHKHSSPLESLSIAMQKHLEKERLTFTAVIGAGNVVICNISPPYSSHGWWKMRYNSWNFVETQQPNPIVMYSMSYS